MNVGQRLAALTGLTGVSALAHLAALQAGAGPAQTVFADRFTLLIEEPRMTLTRRPVKAAAPVEKKPTASSKSAVQPAPPFIRDEVQQMSVRLPVPAVFATSDIEEVFIRERAAVRAVVRRMEDRVFVGNDTELATLQE